LNEAVVTLIDYLRVMEKESCFYRLYHDIMM